ncbi:hypothetical protein [Kaarinaea lacus]
MNRQLLKIYLIAAIIAIAGCNKEDKAEKPESTPMAEESTAAAETGAAAETTEASQEKPSIQKESVLTMEATVTAVNPDTREVTLQNAAGETVTVVAGDEVRNFAQIAVGDKLTVEYMEAVDIQVLGPEEAEVGAEGVAGAARAQPGEKPAGAMVSETTVVVVIEAIDKEMETVTVKGPSGNSKTVKVENPANLDKVSIGDKVRITYTESLAIEVTEN